MRKLLITLILMMVTFVQIPAQRIDLYTTVEVEYVDEYPLTRRLIRFHHYESPHYVLLYDDIYWEIMWDHYYDPWYYEPVFYYSYYDHRYYRYEYRYTYYDYRYYDSWRYRPRTIVVNHYSKPKPRKVDTYTPNR